MATPIALFTFDDNLSDLIGGNTLTQTGSIPFTSGYYKSAVDFGVHSASKLKYFTINDSNIVTNLSSLTITAWVRPSGGTDRQTLFSNLEPSPTTGLVIRYNNATTTTEVYLRTGGTFVGGNFASSNLPNNIWTHVAVVWNGTNFRLYKDTNITPTTVNGASAILGGSTPRIGGSAYHPVHKDWSGMIDDFRIYDKALDEAEVIQSSLEWVIRSPIHLSTYCPSNNMLFSSVDTDLFVINPLGNVYEKITLPFIPVNIFYDSCIDRIYVLNASRVITINPHNLSQRLIELPQDATDAVFSPKCQGSVFTSDTNIRIIR